MSDLSSQLSLVPRDADTPVLVPAADQEAIAHTAPPGFAWPTPPYAVYPSAAEHPAFEPCEVLGLNGKAMAARLIAFDPAAGLAQVQVPPSRTTLALRSSQFRSLTLTQPLRPGLSAATGAPGALMDYHPATPFTVRLTGGGELTGHSIGHVETPHGLYFFPPVDDNGAVLRMFCPRSAYESFDYGPRLGEQLLADDTATPAQIAAALAEQSRLREQRIGDMLLSDRVVSPEQLMQAIDTQSRMPMVRVGAALIALGYISPG